MLRTDFHYQLPDDLIAQYPSETRGDSRLLVLDRESGQCRDHMFPDIVEFLGPGDILVFNDTRVIPARLFGRKDSGGKVEILVERVLGPSRVLAQMRASKAVREGMAIRLEDGNNLLVAGRREGFYELTSGSGDIEDILRQSGHVPLPPYIRRPDQPVDSERYQTVYAASPGAVAAPTAGLHFTREIIEQIRARGCKTAYVTLHVSAGTFVPVRVDDVRQHKMHSERYMISGAVCDAVNNVRQGGGRVVAVGTTSVRVLESACGDDGQLYPREGETDIFIFPGYPFRIVDALLTNFHLPESTLLMLVSAFAGKDNVLAAYRHAIARRYRFFSYGDAMYIADINAQVSGKQHGQSHEI